MNELLDLSLLAEVAEAAADVPGEVDVIGFRLLLISALFVLPYVVAAGLARMLRLKEFSNRIGTVLLAFTLGLAPFVYQMVATGKVDGWKEAIRFGIDLAGGTNLIYQVETKQAQEEGKSIKQAMDGMVPTIVKRINPSGTEEVTVRRVGQDRIEIIIPGADQGVVAEKKAAMLRLGSLEFGIVANSHDQRHRGWIAAASRLTPKVNKLTEGDQVVAVWRDVSEKEEKLGGDIGRRTVTRKDKFGKDQPAEQVLIIQEREEDLVTGKYLTRASTGLGENMEAAVNFSFNSEGATRFFRLTDRYKPKKDGSKSQLAIILDGKVHSAPNINSAIRSQGQITGNFSPQELQALVNVLNAGALELPINPTPISEFSISPLLGADVQRKGIFALWVSSLAVFVFMAVYYRFCGVIADISLLLNLVLTLGVMVICNATFTLPGLAGMVLGLGMSVDANVLIYERMREEMERGSNLRMEILNGFDKAFSAIWDSNVTTLIAAVVLYMIGTDQIRGFAVTLFIGICMSNFSALYFGHLVFDIAERKRWISKLNMMKLIGVPKFDFIGKMKTAVLFSTSFIVLGLVLLLARGTDSLDIDFSGGSSVTFQFEQNQQIDDVRGKLQKTFDSMSLERLALPDEAAAAETGKQFRLRSKEQELDTIRKGIADTFADATYKLHSVTVQFTAPIAATETKAPVGNGGSTEATTFSEKPGDQPPSAQGDDELKAVAAKDEGRKTDVSKKESADKADTEKKSDPPKSEPKPESNEGTPAATKSEGDKTTVPQKDEAAVKTELPRSKAPAKPTNGSTTPVTTVEADEDPFASGHQSELTFSSEISAVTAADYVRAALSKIKGTQIDSALIRVTGITGSGLNVPEGKPRTFDKMLLETHPSIAADDLAKALADVQQLLATTPIFEEVNNFASSVAEDMRYLAILALLASGVATVVYLWFRFTKADFGLAAVVAVFHDVLFVLAVLPMASFLSRTPLGPMLGLDDFKLNLSIIAAFLTIIGYSLNDTIVIFDRIREIRGRNPQLTPQMVNDSVNQTLSRTILTALIVFITVVILYCVGGEGIHGFAFCMLIGTIVGTYSTVFIASPFLLWMMNRDQQRALAARK